MCFPLFYSSLQAPWCMQYILLGAYERCLSVAESCNSELGRAWALPDPLKTVSREVLHHQGIIGQVMGKSWRHSLEISKPGPRPRIPLDRGDSQGSIAVQHGMFITQAWSGSALGSIRGCSGSRQAWDQRGGRVASSDLSRLLYSSQLLSVYLLVT